MPPGGERRGGAEVNSALGTALRRALLAFDALPFEVTQLTDSFHKSGINTV